MSRWLVIGALGALTACIVSIDESKLNAEPNRGGDDDDDDDTSKKDAGKLTDGGKDALVEAAPIEAGVVLPASCQAALNDDPGAANGPTTIGFQNQALTVFCDQGTRGGGWTMLHRLSAGPGITGDPINFYNSFGLHDTELAEITPKHTNAHYTSRLLSHWNTDFPVKQAMVRIYDAAGNPLKELVFDAGPVGAAPASTYTTFFLPERLLASSWTDLSKDLSFSDFTVEGSNDIVRRFNINRKYATCDTDVGWLVAHGSAATVACTNYELPSDHIRIYYAPATTGQKWLDAVSDASSLAVFAR
jgi:hypothetical protein